MNLRRLFGKKPFTWASRKRASMLNKETCTSFRGLHGCAVEERLEEAIDWELRPGGMLVQRRDFSSDLTSGPFIKVKVFHGLHQHDITIPARATFGDMKWLLAQETGLQLHEQRLLFRGKEKEDSEFLHIAGVMDMAKVILVEDPASKEKKLKELKKNNTVGKACQQAVAGAQAEADKIARQEMRLPIVNASRDWYARASEQAHMQVMTSLYLARGVGMLVCLLEGDPCAFYFKAQDSFAPLNPPTGVETREAAISTDKLDLNLELKKALVRRVQSFSDHMDSRKLCNSSPICSNRVVLTLQWETFGSGHWSFIGAPHEPVEILSSMPNVLL